MSKKIIFRVAIIIFLIIGIVGFLFYQKIYSNNVVKTASVYIRTTDDFNALIEKIAPIVKNIDNFTWVSSQKKFTKPRPGRYILKEGMSNNDVVNMLRSGNQTAVTISFNNQDTLEKFAGRIAEQLDVDSISLRTSFTDKKFLSVNNLSEKSVLQIFIPNSYQFYWNTSADKFRDKMYAEYNRFWNKSRLQKAKKLNLSKDQVITLASIVQKETAQNSERPIVAGLYLNRLEKGWPLQADPTIIYCVKEVKGQDYVVKRVLTVDLEINSPYNTYKYKGLPPTLIAMPDISAIDGVLNAEKHNYYYMCVNVEKLGFHAFARTLAQHNRNAVKYHQWLNKQGVHR